MAAILVRVLVALMLAASGGNALAGKMVRVAPDLDLYYEEAGKGPPLIFITGWTGSHQAFLPQQFRHFAQRYRVLAYDPRSQGRSTKTSEGNNYSQHGKDLRAFIGALKLEKPIVVAWSWGCHDVYGYFRAYGTENIRAFVCIDQPPRSLPDKPSDWADFTQFSEVGDFMNGLIADRRSVMREFIPTMMQRKMTEAEVGEILDQVAQTPDHVAVLLATDATFADYTPEAKRIDGRIPVLLVSSEARAEAASQWRAANAPAMKIVALGNHMMFREYPVQFNAALDQFFSQLP